MFTTGIKSQFDYSNLKYAVSLFFVARSAHLSFDFIIHFLYFFHLLYCFWFVHLVHYDAADGIMHFLIWLLLSSVHSIYLSVYLRSVFAMMMLMIYSRLMLYYLFLHILFPPTPPTENLFFSLIISIHFTYMLLCAHNTIATIHRVYIWVSVCVCYELIIIAGIISIISINC